MTITLYFADGDTSKIMTNRLPESAEQAASLVRAAVVGDTTPGSAGWGGHDVRAIVRIVVDL